MCRHYGGEGNKGWGWRGCRGGRGEGDSVTAGHCLLSRFPIFKIILYTFTPILKIYTHLHRNTNIHIYI